MKAQFTEAGRREVKQIAGARGREHTVERGMLGVSTYHLYENLMKRIW